jgi:aryl-alcohol dehydrogenase-like predicted oxidoreductase
MRYRRLGTTESQISEVGFGAWGIGGKQWQGGSDDESLKALERSFELGLTLIDTALAYGDGHSEELVGKAVNRSLHRLFVATKIPPSNRVWPSPPGTPMEQVFPHDYIVRCTEESLRNLRTEQIYLQQFHTWNSEWTATEEWRRAVEALRKSGKVRFFGISLPAHDPDSGMEAVKTGLISAVQVMYNIFDPSAEKNLFPLCIEHKVGVLARVPLDEGGLTGTITEDTHFEPGEFRAEYFKGDRKREVVERVSALKRDLAGVPGSLAEIALRFCLSHPAVSTVIPGMRRVATAESNCRVSDAGPLDEKILAILKRHVWPRNFYL